MEGEWARNDRLGSRDEGRVIRGKIRTTSWALTLIICFFRGFAPVGSLFLRLRRIAQRHQNVQFEMNKTYAEVEGKEIFQVGCSKSEVERGKLAVSSRKAEGAWFWE